jgi:hypothetical protein
MRNAISYLLCTATVVGIVESVRWAFAEGRASTNLIDAGEVGRLRNDVAVLQKQLDLLRDEVRLANAKTVDAGREVATRHAVDPGTPAREPVPVLGFDAGSHQLVVFLWRCLHDRDGVMARLEKQGVSPFDPGVQEIVQETYYRIDDLRALAPRNLEAVQRRRSIADGLEEQIRTGNVSSADLSRTQQEIDRLRNSDDLSARELETALNTVLDDMAQQLSGLRSR